MSVPISSDICCQLIKTNYSGPCVLSAPRQCTGRSAATLFALRQGVCTSQIAFPHTLLLFDLPKQIHHARLAQTRQIRFERTNGEIGLCNILLPVLWRQLFTPRCRLNMYSSFKITFTPFIRVWRHVTCKLPNNIQLLTSLARCHN